MNVPKTPQGPTKAPQGPTKGTPATPEFRAWFDDKLATLVPILRATVANGIPHPPCLMIYSSPTITGEDEQFAILPLELANKRDKDHAAYLHMALANETAIVSGVISVIETWVLEIDTADKARDTQNDPKPGDSIANHPDRRESMMLNAMSGTMQLMAFYPILRPSNTLGEPRIVDPMSPTTPAVGRMIVNIPEKH